MSTYYFEPYYFEPGYFQGDVSPSGSIDEYLSLIIPEHRQQPTFLSMMSVLLQPLADMQQVTNSIPGLYDLDTAVGSQLDTVALWIGASREIDESFGVGFSFDTIGLGFDQGYWLVPGHTVLTALPDDEYRLYLYATVAANHWDGTVPGAETACNVFWNPKGFSYAVIDHQNMTVSEVLRATSPDSSLSLLDEALFLGGYLSPRAAGVGVISRQILPFSGTAATEGNDIVHAVATVGVTAHGAIVEGSDRFASVVFVGTHTLTGAILERSDHVDIFSSPAATGSAAMIESGDVFAAVAHMIATGSAGVHEHSDRAVSVSTVTATGSGAVLETADDAAAVGVV
jgi:hypothetical protein